MAAQAMTGAIQRIHKTLSTTVEDRVTITGVAGGVVRVTNRHATNPMYAKGLATATDVALVADADNSICILAGTSRIVPVTRVGESAWVAIVGSANPYSVELGSYEDLR